MAHMCRVERKLRVHMTHVPSARHANGTCMHMTHVQSGRHTNGTYDTCAEWNANKGYI